MGQQKIGCDIRSKGMKQNRELREQDVSGGYGNPMARLRSQTRPTCHTSLRSGVLGRQGHAGTEFIIGK